MNIEGKAALVTGGGTGVGRATALLLARQGCSVAVNYSQSQREAEQTASELAAGGVNSLAVHADVADDLAVRRMVDQAVAALGRLDVLVNCAGTTRFIDHADLEQVRESDWHRIFAVNVVGAFHAARAVRPHMLAVGGGEIVNVSSVAALTGTGSSIPYAVSKGALNNLTIGLAKALAPQIRVNGVAPGFITGRWLQRGLGEAYEAVKASVEKAAALQRVCDPQDVAACILSLICGSDLVTGQTLVCDGGATMGKGGLPVAR